MAATIDLTAPLPMTVTHEEKEYKLCPWFDNVLAMMQATKGCSPWERVQLMLYFLIDEEHPDDPELLQSVMAVLFPTQKKGDASSARALDLFEDADLIYAAFYQVYGIDLFSQQGKMHWLTFQALLQGLPEGTRFSDIVKIRTQPLPKPDRHNGQMIAQLMQMKTQYSLPVDEEERKQNLKNGLEKLAYNLMQLAETNMSKK